jgi:UDP-glucose 4-epimerase
MTILITGGAGYIGSHTALNLLDNDHDVVVIDNLINSNKEAIYRVERLTQKPITFYQGDIRDSTFLDNVFSLHKIETVIHFAALKAVGESIKEPKSYYLNNVFGTLCLLEAMQRFAVNQFIFSSSATVYGEAAPVPYFESLPLGVPTSPYGKSKVMVEQILFDNCIAQPEFKAVSLRYFNPIGAHESGLIGEDPKGTPNNLLPFIAQVAVGKRQKLNIFGDDYPTKDGTCERDYLHVMDLAEGHASALNWLSSNKEFYGVEVFNLGTGNAISVIDMVKTFEKITGQQITYQISSRRSGDLPAFWADPIKARKVLGWQASRDLTQMVKDTWNWQKSNPEGYSK